MWFAKYRLPDGRAGSETNRPAWTERGRPPAGYFNKRTAEDWLRALLDEARSGTLLGMVQTGATFADAAAEWLRYIEQDAAIFLTAAFTGLRRGELVALRWRDVDFSGSVIRVRSSYHEGVPSTPKSGKVRSVPMAPDVAEALAKLGTRDVCVGDDDLVFLGDFGSYVDARALVRRYDAALTRGGLRRLRFHDLRHTFGTQVIAKADIRRVQEWMGHADIQTTMKYLHYAPREEDARLVAEASRIRDPGLVEDASSA